MLPKSHSQDILSLAGFLFLNNGTLLRIDHRALRPWPPHDFDDSHRVPSRPPYIKQMESFVSLEKQLSKSFCGTLATFELCKHDEICIAVLQVSVIVFH